MTRAQKETVATLREISSDECESMNTEFHVSESGGYVYFEMSSENVYRSGEVNASGDVSWN